MKKPIRTFKTLTPGESSTATAQNRYVGKTKAPQQMLKKEAFRETDAELLAERKRKDNQEYTDRLDRLATAKKAENKNVIGDKDWRQNLADKTGAIGDKLRVSNKHNFFDDNINPASWVGDKAAAIGQAPKEAKESNSIMPYVTSLADPIITGAMAGIGAKVGGSTLKGLARQANELFNPLAGVSKSSLDWGKWNKEIPLNKPLMKEYGKIEKTSKAKGTWMKNPDGSKFEGTPEQFVQQNSENFKKAFDNILKDSKGNVLRVNHGSPEKFTEFDQNKFGSTTDMGDKGVGTYVTPLEYSKNYGDNQYNLYVNAKSPLNASNFIDQSIPISAREHLADSKLRYFHRNVSEKMKNKGIKQYLDKDIVIGDEFYPKINENAFEMVIPFSNRMKSARNNNGMFDMTNPNIYKAVVPAAVAGKLAKDKYDNKKPESSTTANKKSIVQLRRGLRYN